MTSEHHKTEAHTHHAHHANAQASDSEVTERKPVDSKKSLTFILAVVGVIVLMIVTTIVLSKYVFVNKNVVEYNHYIFQKSEGNIWSTQQLIKGQLYDIPFHNNPTQVLDIPVDPQAIAQVRGFSNNSNGVVYIVVDPYETSKVVLAGVEYARLLGDVYNIYNMNVKSAISTPVDVNTSSPVITCKNQSRNTMVIYQTVTNKNLVSIKGNCIILESIDINDSVRVADAFAFRLLNIIIE